MRRPLMVGGYTSPATPPPFNRAPVVDLNGVSVGRDTSVFFVEGDPRVSLAPAATVTDLDNNPIVYMSISCVDISGDDEYLWFNDEQFSLLFDKIAIASNGVVDFSVQYVAATQVFLVTVAGGGSTSLANVQSFIRLISYENLSVPVSSGDRSFIFVVNDNVNNSNPATCVVNVSGVNYAPEIDLNGIDSGNTISHTFVEGDILLSLCPSASISDSDNDPLFSMSLVLTGVTADDESITIGSPGVSFSLDIDDTQIVSAGLATFEVSYTSSNTTFQIVPNGISDSSISNWQSLLRTVKYLNNSAPTTPGDRIVSVFVDDNIDTSIPVDITVTVESVSNNPPFVNLGSGNNYSSTFVKGASATSICPSATISDLDGDPLSSIAIVGASISNGVDEILLINGVSFPLNSNLTATTIVGSTLFGISYTTSSQTFVITKSGGGTFSISDAQSLVRTVSYKNTSSSPTYGNRTFTFTVNDGEDDSNSPVATVNFRNTLNIVSNGSGGGTWGSVGTWVGGVVPQDGDTVDIVATDTVNISSSVSCGSYTGTLPGIRLRGSTSSVYAKLTVADGATLVVKGVNVLTYPAIHIERYARFEPQPGSTVICDGTTSSQTGILVRGIMDAIGTLEKPITFTMPSDGINWNSSVSSYSRPASTLLWKYDQDRNIACVAFQDSNISNASGTGVGSYLDTSVAFTSKSPSTILATPKASISAITSVGDYYIDHYVGVVYFYHNYASNPSFSVSYKKLDVTPATWRGWSIYSAEASHAGNTYCRLQFDYCNIRYMGHKNSNQPAIRIGGKRSVAAQGDDTRLFKLTNSTIEFCGGVLWMGNLTNQGTAEDPLLFTGNLIRGCDRSEGVSGHVISCGQSDSNEHHYFKIDNNTINNRFFMHSGQYNGYAQHNGWEITNNVATGMVSFFIDFNPPTSSFPNSLWEGNVIDSIGTADRNSAQYNRVWLDIRGSVSGNAVIRNNTISHCGQACVINKYVDFENNYVHAAWGTGIIGGSGFWGYAPNVTIQNNIFSGTGSCSTSDDYAAITVAIPNIGNRAWFDNWKVINNTFVNCKNGAISFGQVASGVPHDTLVTRFRAANNIVHGGDYAIRKETAESNESIYVGCAQLDYNLLYNQAVSSYQNINKGATFLRSGSLYADDATRAVEGVDLWNPTYALNQSGKSLALTVTTPDSNVTLSWDGGTPVQLVKETGTMTDDGRTDDNDWAYLPETWLTSEGFSVQDTGKTWSTNRTNANCPSGKWLKFTSGAASGQVCAILDNSATELVVAPVISPLPSLGDTYTIYESQVTLSNSGSTEFVAAGIYLPDLPGTSQTDSNISVEVTNTITSNPLLVNSTGLTSDSFALQEGSPAIDAGTSNGAPATDFFGLSRPQDGADDMGAIEYSSFVFPPSLSSSDKYSVIGDTVSWEVTNSGDMATYSLAALPDSLTSTEDLVELGLSLNSSNGTISGTLSGSAKPGIYRINVDASNSGGSDSVEYYSHVLSSSAVSLTVHVMDYLGANLSGAEVTITDKDISTVYSGNTDASGLCSSISLNPRNNPFTITITKSGMTTDVLPLRILDSMTFKWRLMATEIQMDNAYLSSLPKTLPTSNRKYKLMQNVSAPAGALVAGAAGINIDLNGYTITYLDGGYGVTNFGFESGAGSVPDNWDLGTSGAERVSTYSRPCSGSYYLSWPRDVNDKTIISEWSDLPLNQTCKASWVTPVPTYASDVYFLVEIEHSVSGIIAQKLTNAGEGHLRFSSGAVAGQFRFRMTRKGYPNPDIWQANHTYSIGDTVSPTISDGFVRKVQSIGGVSTGTTGVSQPTWPTTIGSTVADNNLIWRLRSIGALGEGGTVWSAGLSRSVGQTILPTGGTPYIFECIGITVSGNSGSSQPTWNTSSTTSDNTLVWSVGLIYDQWSDSFSSGPEDYAIDELQLSPYTVRGIYAASAARVSVYNGSIIQGSPGDRCSAVNLQGAVDLYIVNCHAETVGTNSSGLAVLNSSGHRILSSSAISTNEIVYDRSGLYSLIECSGVTDGLVLGNRAETYGLIGIKIDDEQCEARWNHILSHGVITNHPGLLVRGGVTSSANACHAHYNTVFSNPGHCLAVDRLLGNAHSYGNTVTNNRLIYYSIRPNVEYGWLQFDVIRSNDYGSTTSAKIFDFSIDSNYIDIHCRLDTRHAPPLYAYIGGISCVWNGTGNVIHDNVIKIRAVDPEVYGWGIDVGNSLSNPIVDIYNNHITTDWFAFLQGQYSDDSENLLFRSNTIVRGPNYTASYAPFGMHVSAATMFTNGEFRDTTVDFGSMETFTLAPNSGSETIGQPYTWDVSGTLTLTVSNGSSPIVGASVSITNAQSTVVFSGITDVSGQVRPVLKKTRVLRNAGSYTYTNYNNHTISVSAAGYVSQNVSHTAAIVPESRTITMASL